MPFLIIIAVWLLGVAGWITNVVWTFQQTGTEVLLGILGALVFPIGAFHGMYLWF